MTEYEKNQPTEKLQIFGLKRLITLQTALQTIVILIPIIGFYYKTNDRLDAMDAAQKRTEEVIRYHNGWLTNLSIKTGVNPPTEETKNEN